MTTTTTTTTQAQQRAKRIHKQALKLRALRHSFAARIAQQARIVAIASKKLLKLHASMDKTARKIAGPDYRQYHEVTFEEFPSIADQRREDDGAVQGPGLEDVRDLAVEMARWAGEVASADAPPQLPSE